MTSTRHASLWGFALVACAADGTAQVATQVRAVDADNGLPMNGLPMNGLPMNGLPMNGLDVSDFDNVAPECRDALTRKIATCALTGDQVLTFVNQAGVVDTAPGLLGLAPEWLESSITTEQMTYIYACLAALINDHPMTVSVITTGSCPAVTATATELETYEWKEGAYFAFHDAATGSYDVYVAVNGSFTYADPLMEYSERKCSQSIVVGTDACPLLPLKWAHPIVKPTQQTACDIDNGDAYDECYDGTSIYTRSSQRLATCAITVRLDRDGDDGGGGGGGLTP